MNVEALAIIAVSGFVAVMILMTVGIMIYLIIRASRGGSNQSRKADAEETRLIQEIHHGLRRMEDRVQTLETLVLDDDKLKRDNFDRDLNRG